MNYDPGDKILRTINEIKQQPSGMIITNRNEMEFNIVRDQLVCRITVNPERELAANLQILGADGLPEIEYSIDTDLYDIKNPDYWRFAQDVEEDIVALIEAIKSHELLYMKRALKSYLVVPAHDSVVLVKQGRYFGSKTQYKSLEEINNLNNFKPI
jgi:hypothetical protein